MPGTPLSLRKMNGEGGEEAARRLQVDVNSVVITLVSITMVIVTLVIITLVDIT